MPTDHPRDDDGRVLPHPWWPAGREAPGELEFVRRFLNTRNRENGADRLATPLGVGTFLESEERPGFLPEPDDRDRIVAVRERLHGMAIVHGQKGDGDAADVPGAGTVLDVCLQVEATPGTLAVIAPTGTGTDRLLGDLVRIVLVHQSTGEWDRLVACHHCRWVVYDSSRNRSTRWCSMDACGGRHNARAYRRRRSR